MASTLCQLCASIPLQDLPRFPDESYSRTLSGQPNLHILIHKDTFDDIPDPLGFHHHGSLDLLRRASASGCELCRLIEADADALVSDITERDSKYRDFPDILERMESDPSFDLWITARPDGGDGFWVVTRSASNPKRVLFVVATLGCASGYDDPLVSAICGRPVNGSPDQKALDLGASWVTRCNDSHGRCNDHETFLPTRLIDVGTLESGSTVKLVEVDEGTKGSYIALSYCWGAGATHFTTSRETLRSRMAGVELSDLPQTFQDAVTMTRILGVPYLWIDGICICQDDLAEWERESARMASVYSNAYLTIAATGKPDSSGGLFFSRPPRKYLRLPLKTTAGIEGHILISPLNKEKEVIKSYRIEMRSEPLAKRAWAFQERVLARRVLHFASDQISFECLEGSLYEDGLQLPDRYYSAYVTDCSREDDAAPGPATRTLRSPKDHWNALLWVYGDLKLTYPADKLPALAGIAKVYSKLIGDEYVAGVWRNSIVEGLCWQSLKCKAVSGPYRAPTWSWASVDGIPATGFRGESELLATMLNYKVEIDGDNPFGRVKSGWIDIEAPLIPLTLSDAKGPMGHMFLKTKGGDDGAFAGFDTIDKLYETSAGAVRDMELFALVMAVVTTPVTKLNPREAGHKVYQTLIVTSSDSPQLPATSFKVMKRVGMMLQSAENFGPGELTGSRATVRII